ncbi:hypothetical protein EWM64_g6150 [Hericium alpestre]|uniref:Uncharacterized protein n=1 Tax=Hericium alpestre TaxID=135208 RepID=A0A4Y9ZUK3_9AGAM|nr:hypothetical protein EWM64_g6150 [Hericium alpestre]
MEIVQYELKTIQGLWEEQEDIRTRFPCPFLSFLLASGWDVNLEPIEDEGAGRGLRTGHGSIGGSSMDPDMGSGDGDNNDGITVIDVTDPASPAYCFVSVNGLEAQGASPEPEHYIPLSAEQYCRAYYPPQDLEELKSLPEDDGQIECEESVRSVIATLDDVPVIKLASLAEAWPSEYQVSPAAEKEASDSEAAVSADRTQDPILEASLRAILDSDVAGSSGDMEQVYDILTREDYRPRVLAKLRGFLDIPPAGLPLLTKVLAHGGNKASLDLSQLPLSAEQILQVVAEPQSLEVLNLSGNSHLTADALLHILPHLPKLRRLVLLDCPTFSNKEFSTVHAANPALFDPIEAVIHPFFLTFVSEIPYKSRFAIYWFGSMWVMPFESTRHILPTFHPARIVQVLFDLLQPALEEISLLTASHSALSIQTALTGAEL